MTARCLLLQLVSTHQGPFSSKAVINDKKLQMVDEGLSVSLDWNLPSLQYTTPSRTLSINFDPHGEIEDFNGDNEDHDENEDTIEMNENNDALITENRMLGIRETLGREYVSMELVFWHFEFIFLPKK